MCQLLLDFSDQTVKHDNSSMQVQGWYVPCKSASVQIYLHDDE